MQRRSHAHEVFHEKFAAREELTLDIMPPPPTAKRRRECLLFCLELAVPDEAQLRNKRVAARSPLTTPGKRALGALELVDVRDVRHGIRHGRSVLFRRSPCSQAALTRCGRGAPPLLDIAVAQKCSGWIWVPTSAFLLVNHLPLLLLPVATWRAPTACCTPYGLHRLPAIRDRSFMRSTPCNPLVSVYQ